MTIKQLLNYYGSRREAAYRLGYSEAGVRKWEQENRIPPKAQALVERMSGGVLKADKK